jgi:fucose permease
MTTILLLGVIYLAFISLGLPDSILGVAIPAMQADLGIGLSAGGLISMVAVIGTIVSSFSSGYVLKRLGTGTVTLVSTLMTGGALLGFALSPGYLWLVILAVPLGLGAGSVDTALNDYVAHHFRAHHMNWLHSFWGVGATLGPIIMGATLAADQSWRSGYGVIATVQLVLSGLFAASFPLWSRHKAEGDLESSEPQNTELSGTSWRQPGVGLAFATMLLYCSVELGAGLWGASFLSKDRGLPLEAAASWMAMYYGGITLGRFVSGFISFKLSNTSLIRGGALIALAGFSLLLFPFSPPILGASFVLAGFGLAPIFPAMIHETPQRFGSAHSRKIIGFQMGFAYVGNAIIPPLLGVLFQAVSLRPFPVVFAVLGLMLLVTSEILTIRVRGPRPS